MFDALRLRYRHATTTRVDSDANGFRCTSGRGMLRNPRIEARAWTAVNSITAFKADAYTTDCIYLLFEGSEPAFTIDETMEGYQEFVQRIPEFLPGALPFAEWFLAVAFPAFDPNPTVIYRRSP